MRKFTDSEMQGVWSATPTPLDADLELDVVSLPRLMEHHLRLGVKGLFLGGTSGEGPWLPDATRLELALRMAKLNHGRILLAMQVTDNSSMRILDNIKRIADTGIDIAVVAPPFFQANASQEYLQDLYLEVIEKSPLPVGVYHRGKHSSVLIEPATLEAIIRHPNVVVVKDSSSDVDSRNAILRARNDRKGELWALNGNEFDCIPYLQDGYDGLMLGGACFNGFIAGKIIAATQAGDIPEAKAMQERMNKLMFDTFGGEGNPCWLAGQKQMMVELGIFNTNRTIINYQITDACLTALRAALIREKAYLLP